MRKEGDSNPRYLAVQRFSRPPDSATLASFQLNARIIVVKNEARRVRTADLQIRNLTLYPAEL